VAEPGADSRAVARRALADAVSRYGPTVLGNPVLLRKSFDDYMPDAPRELSALVAVAQAEGGRELSERVSQGLDPDTAVRLTCSTLGEQLALDPSVLVWAVSEYAETMGYQTTPVPPPGPSSGGVPPPPVPGTVIASEAPGPPATYQNPATRLESQAASPTPTVVAGYGTQAASGAPPASGPPPGYGPNASSPVPPGPSEPARQGARVPRAVIAGGAAVAVLVIILVVVLVSHHGGNHSNASSSTTTEAPSPAAVPLGTLPATTVAPTTVAPTTVAPTTTVPAPVEATQAQVNAAVLNVQDLGGPSDATPESTALCGAYTRPDLSASAAFSLGSKGSIGDLANLVGAYPTVAAVQQVIGQVPATVPGCVGASTPFTVQMVGGTLYCDQSYEGYSPFVGDGGVTMELYFALIRCGTTLEAVELVLNSNIPTASAQKFANTVYENAAAKLTTALQ
jgi:hypothetical protein